MENVGDWIYIIVLAVIGISSVLTSGKKKKAEEQARKQQRPPDERPPDVVTTETASDRDFWDILTENEDLSPVVKQMPKKQSTPKQAVKTPQPTPFLKGESEIERTIRKQGASAIFKEEEEIEPLVTAEDFRDPESLRKAVIYTEILRRKF